MPLDGFMLTAFCQKASKLKKTCLITLLVQPLAMRSSTPVRAGVAGTALGESEREAQTSRTGLSLCIYIYIYVTYLSLLIHIYFCKYIYILILYVHHVIYPHWQTRRKWTNKHVHSTFQRQNMLIPNSSSKEAVKASIQGSSRELSMDSQGLKALTLLFSPALNCRIEWWRYTTQESFVNVLQISIVFV